MTTDEVAVRTEEQKRMMDAVNYDVLKEYAEDHELTPEQEALLTELEERLKAVTDYRVSQVR